METNIALAELGPPRSLHATHVAEDVEREAQRKRYVLAGLVLISCDHALLREAEGLARLRTARAALAVERFRLANGRLPAELNQLTPRFLATLPRDPFDGEQLRYKLLPTGYVLYSIGPDGRDDGGKEYPTKPFGKTTPPYDITITVER